MVMEQKQLDETDESFFAEEYLDEESLDEIFDELDAKESAVNSAKSNPFSAVDLSGSKQKKDDLDSRKVKDVKDKKEDKKVVKVAMAKTEPKVEKNTFSAVKSEARTAPKEEIVITPVKMAAPSRVEAKPVEKKNEEKMGGEVKAAEKTAKYVETAPPRVDPWADDKKDAKKEAKKDTMVGKSSEEGMFKDASTWKALTGITIVLLLFSVFTQGFQFAEKGLTVSQELTLKDAEAKATSFVNDNLLRPPFFAQLVSSAEANGLYRVTLSVAGQTVDSYLTKDGKLFFPQGLDTSLKLTDDVAGAGSANPGDVSETKPVEVKTQPAKPSEPVVVKTPEPTAPSVGTVEVSVNAKRWLFTPPQVSVKQGDTVVFKIVPENLDFTFAIPDLGVQQEVKGPTSVTLTVTKAGSFEYTCGSCEDWRGMKGTLVVE